MSYLKKIKICDPLYDYVYFEEVEKPLLEHPLFQRLRAIRQLGFSDQAFPSGTHSRFSHSLGSAHLAGLAFDSIFDKPSVQNQKQISLLPEEKKKFKKILKTSALLHDIGHGPLSHFCEPLMPSLNSLGISQFLNPDVDDLRPARHEDYSLKFILEKQGLYNVIQQVGVPPEAIAQLLHPQYLSDEDFFMTGGVSFKPLFRQIISSEFDVDRMDYLQRDSLHCGVKYGALDFSWLISHFGVHIQNNQAFLNIGKGGLYTLESFMLGRQHMRLIVYFHHKSVIYNKMLRQYKKESDFCLPADLKEYALWTDSRLKEHLSKEDNLWAKKITTQTPFVRLKEFVFFNPPTLEKEDGGGLKEIFQQERITLEQEKEHLKRGLKNKDLAFIEVNSLEDSLTPYKGRGLVSGYHSDPIYIDHKELSSYPGLLRPPRRIIHRIYIDPKDLAKANQVIKDE